MTSGIPLGSIVGSVLFLVFINNLPNIAMSTTKLFVDDTKLYRAVSTDKDRRAHKDDIDSLWTRSETWQLPFNEDKCKLATMATTT